MLITFANFKAAFRHHADHCEYIGSGIGATAHTRKRSTTVTKAVFGDSAYLTYVHWCRDYQRTHGENKHLPKVHAVHMVENEDHAIVILEKLHPLPAVVQDVISYLFNLDPFNLKAIEHAREAIWRRRKRRGYTADDFHEYDRLMSEDFLCICREVHNNAKGQNDMHSGNFMARKAKDGSIEAIVITDPWFAGINTGPFGTASNVAVLLKSTDNESSAVVDVRCGDKVKNILHHSKNPAIRMPIEAASLRGPLLKRLQCNLTSGIKGNRADLLIIDEAAKVPWPAIVDDTPSLEFRLTDWESFIEDMKRFSAGINTIVGVGGLMGLPTPFRSGEMDEKGARL